MYQINGIRMNVTKSKTEILTLYQLYVLAYTIGNIFCSIVIERVGMKCIDG